VSDSGLDRYLSNASDVSLENTVLMKMGLVSKHRRAVLAEIDRITDELADVKFIQRELDRRRRQLTVVETKDRKAAG
jgi:hypothetical protein